MGLIYIISPGHSGSTLLDMLLGSHPEIFSSGELINLPNQYLNGRMQNPSPLNGFLCTCGKGFNECEFWGTIYKRINEYRNKQLDIDPLRFKISFIRNHSRPYSSKSIKVYRHFYRQIINSNQKFIDNCLHSIYKREKQNNEKLFNEVINLANVSYLIDSSKDYFRLHFLMKSKIDIKLIVLKRSIFGVASSSKKLNSDPVLSAIRWIKFYNRLDKLLMFHNISPINVIYEDLINNTKEELSNIYKKIGLETNENNNDIVLQSSKYHIVSGNGLRYQEEIKIRRSDNWKTILTENEIESITQLL